MNLIDAVEGFVRNAIWEPSIVLSSPALTIEFKRASLVKRLEWRLKEAYERRRQFFKKIARKEGKMGIHVESRVRVLEMSRSNTLKSIDSIQLEMELRTRCSGMTKEIMWSLLSIQSQEQTNPNAREVQGLLGMLTANQGKIRPVGNFPKVVSWESEVFKRQLP